MPKSKRRSSGKSRKINRPCTYDLGYVRQDLYACHKCTRAAKGQFSGFCRGCRDTCHADHMESTFELYTKRAFRCDCGNTRAKNTCYLQPDKDDLNTGNEHSYSHNFEGRYCRCDSLYDYRLAMAQCAMCEDWFHEDCYKTDSSDRASITNPSNIEDGYEFTCCDCVQKLPVLAEYYEVLNAWEEGLDLPQQSKRGECTRPRSTNIHRKAGTIDYLWVPGFRTFMCRCWECMALYEAARAKYIVDRGDFVGAPQQEDLGLLNATNDEEIVNDVLREDAVQQRKEAKRKSALDDTERIPRKPLARSHNAEESLSKNEEVLVQRRIKNFIQRCIETDGHNINPDSLRGYLCDLKAEMLSNLPEQLRA